MHSPLFNVVGGAAVGQAATVSHFIFFFLIQNPYLTVNYSSISWFRPRLRVILGSHSRKRRTNTAILSGRDISAQVTREWALALAPSCRNFTNKTRCVVALLAHKRHHRM